MSRWRAVPWLILIGAVLVVELGWRAPATPGEQVREPEALRAVLAGLRSAPFDAISDPDAAAIVSGVVFGRAEQIPTAQQELFLQSGLWHLLAASGQNVALVAGLSVVLARGFGGGRRAGVMLALVAIPAYVLVVGGGASILRAGIVGMLTLVAWLAGRLADLWHVLLVAAIIICLVWPGAHRGLGMQLSFACAVVLLWAAGPCTSWLRERGVPSWLAAGAAATVLCSAATAPILVLRTGAAPVTGIVANLIAVPLAGVILVSGLAGACAHASGLTWVAVLPFSLAGWCAQVLELLAARAAALPGAQVQSRAVLLGLPVVAAATAVGVRRCRARWRMVVVRCGAVAAAACLVWAVASGSAPMIGVQWPGSTRPPPRAPGTLRVAVLDIGQGDATLVVGDGGAVLVDTGPPNGRVVQRVRELGVERLDGIVLTHDSLDHRGGFERALSALRPSWVAKPVRAPGPWRRVRELAPRLVELCDGDDIRLGDAVLEVHNPPCDGKVRQRTSDVHNDGAMVLLVRDDDVRMVLPADAEAPVLNELALPQLDFLRISHHGSSDPDLPRLLEELRPQAAAISVGEGNTYGHPRRDVLEALEAAGVPTMRTDRDGTVVVDSDGSSIRVR